MIDAASKLALSPVLPATSKRQSHIAPSWSVSLWNRLGFEIICSALVILDRAELGEKRDIALVLLYGGKND